MRSCTGSRPRHTVDGIATRSRATTFHFRSDFAMAVSPNLIARVTNILKQPAVEWPIIAAEPADAASLMQGYAAPLAAIPAICRWIGLTLVGVTVPFFATYRVGVVRG